MTTYYLEVITRDRVFFEGQVDRIVARGVEGEFAVLANHSPMVTNLKAGALRIFNPEKEVKEASLSEGFIKVTPKHVIIMADTAQWT
jgi:F-type H+-transporting ATPase subunit epsilon